MTSSLNFGFELRSDRAALWPIAILLAAGCTARAVTASAPRGSHLGSGGVKCALEQVKDDQQSGLVAYTFLVPEGWTPHALFKWAANDAITANLSAATADKHYIVDQIEPMVLSYMAMNRIAPKGIRINRATDFLHAALQQFQQQHSGMSDVQIVEEVNKELPLTKAQEDGASHSQGPMHDRTYLHEAGYLRASFQLDGTDEIADLGTTVTGSTSTITLPNSSSPSSVSQVNQVGPTMLIVSESHASAGKMLEAQIVASSMRMTPQFLDYWRKKTTAMAQAYLDAAGAELKEKNANFHHHSMAIFRGEMAAKDENSRAFCNYLLDQQDYKTRSGSIVTLPYYGHAWSDANGHYLLSDEPTFTPIGTGGWEPLEKARGG